MPKQAGKPLFASQIQEALKNRQNVELRGKSIAVKKLLDDLIIVSHGKAIIPAAHEEDYSIFVINNIVFPTSDKMTPENVMRQVLQNFGWPSTPSLSNSRFYFGKLLKELLHDRVIPVFLFENSEVMRKKSFSILQVLSEYIIGRIAVGIPSIICVTERGRPMGSLTSTSIVIELENLIAKSDIIGLIEQGFPGHSKKFEPKVIKELEQFESLPTVKTAIKDLIRYKQKLGLDTIGEELFNQWKLDRKRRKKYAPAEA